MAECTTKARVDLFLAELRLPSIKKNYAKIAKQIGQSGGDYTAFLHALLEEEVGHRRARRIDRRLKEARFPQIKEMTSLEVKVAAISARPASTRSRPTER